MKHSVDNSDYQAFALWLVKQLTPIDITLINTMIRYCGIDEWTVFEAAIKNHRNAYSIHSQGRLTLKSKATVQKAANTLQIMLKSQDIIIPGVDLDD
jgi:hypothetical protein